MSNKSFTDKKVTESKEKIPFFEDISLNEAKETSAFISDNVTDS